MSNHKMRTRVVSTIAALTLCPTLALAQAGSSPGAGTGSGTQGTQGSQGSQQGSQGSQQGSQGSQQGSQAAPDDQNQGSSRSQGSSGSQTPGAQGTPSASPQGSSSGMTGATSGGSASAQMSAQQSIDPSQIQKVFGTDATLIDLKSLNTEDVRQLQQTLQQRGHYRGELDGVVGPQTRAALRAVLAEQFALNQRLINQGQLTEQVASSVGLDAQGVSPVRGIDTGSMGTPSQSGQQRPSGSMGSSPNPSGSTTTPSGNTGSSPQSGSVAPTTPPAVEEEE